MAISVVLLLTLSLPPDPPKTKVSVDVRAGSVPVAGLWRVLWAM